MIILKILKFMRIVFMKIQVYEAPLENTPLLVASSHSSESKNPESQKKINLHRRINFCVQGVNLILLAYSGVTAHKKFHTGEDVKSAIGTGIAFINACGVFLARHH
ncbi:MAG: hypothetical protein H0X29_08450, partial [Parachlamydiaceae bacterium]|nr:hypothetical protein [Parachlamydiaceae bacterium]